MSPVDAPVLTVSPHRPVNWRGLSGPVQLGLEGCGLAASDTAVLLERVTRGAEIKAISAEISSGLLLSKKSARGRRNILAAVRRRYLADHSPLPGPRLIARALARVRVPVARNQLLLPYLLASDSGLFEMLRGPVEERRTSGARLLKAGLVAEAEAMLVARGQQPWSRSTTTRWVEGVLSVLRDVGALGQGRQREHFLPYTVRPEASGFHLWGLYEAGHRGPALFDPAFWELLLLPEREIRPAVRALADRGWWRFTSVAGVDELRPVHSTLEQWITHGLG